MSTKFKVGDIIRSIACSYNQFDAIVLCIMVTGKGHKYYILEDVKGYHISSDSTKFIDDASFLVGVDNADRATDTRTA